jgi:predicted TIM-barrel fold metal-dependent hydrolase
MAKLPDSIKENISLLDVHTHVGVDPRLYLNHSLPYCRSIDVAHAEAVAVGINRTVCFPWVTSLYYDLAALADGGTVIITGNGIGRAPFHFENEQMLRQLYELFPGYSSHFIPFVIVDTLRETAEQVKVLDELLARFPFYGIKVHPRDTRAQILTLDREGRHILEFAKAHDFPILIHTACTDLDPLSQFTDVMTLADRHPDLRWCAAHFCGFNEAFFKEANRTENVWVDSAALTIGCETVVEGLNIYESGEAKIPADYRRPEEVFRVLAERYPNTFMFGTDNPAHSWIDVTTFADGKVAKCDYRSTMAKEVNLLSQVHGELLQKVAWRNALRFIEG